MGPTSPTPLRELPRERLGALLEQQQYPEAMRLACERMDRLREEIRRRHGTLDIGVPAIRELRDE